MKLETNLDHMIDRNPIETLYDRLILTFENTNKVTAKRLKEYSNDQLSRQIRIDTGPFSSPSADHNTKEIILNQRFLSLIWCITYIIYEIAGNKSRTAISLSKTYILLDGKDDEVQRLERLFHWGFKLKSGGSDEWPHDLPQPVWKDDSVRIVNVIFIDAITYIMFHEVAHIVNGHWDNFKDISTKLRKGYLLSSEEMLMSIQLEQEADNYSYDCLMNSNDKEEVRYHKFFGMIIAGLASLFAHQAGSKLVSKTHPSAHVRIFNTRLRAKFDEGNEFRLNQVMNVGLSLFCKLHGIVIKDQDFLDFSDLLDYLFTLIQDAEDIPLMD